MKRDKDIKKEIKESIILALPIVIGYFPIAMAFGLLSKNTLLSFRDTSFLSLLVYAGASQFMALDLIYAGNKWQYYTCYFLLNLRHDDDRISSCGIKRYSQKIHSPSCLRYYWWDIFSNFFNKDKISLDLFYFKYIVLCFMEYWNHGRLWSWRNFTFIPSI